MRLSEMKVGAEARISRVERYTATTLRLLELGFTEGTRVEMVRRAPFGDPLEVRLHGTRICIRQHDATAFTVDPVDAETA